ncbi:hypothetical protein [Leadbettera azotonutricia]|uniref:Uncharacterized protein n=1 Tax=Leadbettera azotonutricia (strain ATCC BAA-888 / DSM 13862 / ZAS-9) TaxID=545695 RepID=F5YFN3_LEAAZ|nr:hypothetical protein [Leadbettera azotonutricia]AEF83111.1 hypothetical protein TREAZ_2487 [Leadbettera azotonutricia ZAS-9]
MIYEDEFIPSLGFWPEVDVRSAFHEADQAMGTKDEALALRVFYLRMKHHLKTAEPAEDNPDIEFRMIEHYERPMLEQAIAKLRCGACPVPGCPYGGTK